MTETIDQPADELAGSPDEAKVFLSYSRKDRERAQGIADALRSRHFGIFKDTDDILPTEEWKDRLQQLIEEADTIVFLLSPHSATSEVCAWEVEYAHSLNKRIAPIVIEDTEAADIPPLLAQLNFIFCTPRDPFENAVDTLASALSTDIDWIREHTRLAGLAARWEAAGRPARLLLRGEDIADTENWRDGRPKDAPAVTPLQAAFIGESRRAATRRQRGWIGGSLGVAVAAVALAVFAYFQSVEADNQRAEAENQRAEAESQRAEAEKQRAEADLQRVAAEENAHEAERQRLEVSRRLVAQSLLAGNFADATRTMLALDANNRITKTLLAGLATSDEGALRDRPGTPYILNGLLYYSTDGAPVKDERTFPATTWTPAGDDLLLVTDGGRARRVTPEGTVLEDGPLLPRSTACGVHRGPEAVTLVTRYLRGPNLFSMGVELLSAPVAGGPMTLDQPPPNAGSEIDLLSDAGPITIAEGNLFDACDPDVLHRFNTQTFPTWKGIERLRTLEEVRFPGQGPEAQRWTGESDLQTLAENQVARMARNGVSGGPIARLDYMAQQGVDKFPHYTVTLLDDLSRGQVTAFNVLSDQAPQGGGGTFLACVGAFISCHDFQTISDMRVALSPDDTLLAAYGLDLRSENDETGEIRRSNLWRIDSHTGQLSPYDAAIDGEVLSAAFASDNRLAALTAGSLTVYDAEGFVLSRTRRPGNAAAVTWAPDGETLILLGEDGIAVGNHETGFTLTSMTGPTDNDIDRGFSRFLWMAQDADDGVLALGYGRQVVIYDMALGAPLTRPFDVPHPLVWNGSVSGTTLEALEDGGFRLGIAREVYERIGWGDDEQRDRLDLGAIFR